MNRFARYAIYYMPDPESPLWSLASSWLGRDAVSGRDLQRPDLPALAGINLDRLTAGPRRYGFHGTLKAPFEAADTATEDGLLQALDDFTARSSPFELRLEVGALGDFVALRPAEPSPSMDALHGACVCDFDAYRKPISEADLARKRGSRLTPDQDANLVRWGYPYILDQFRFHMTLTSRIACKASQGPIREALEALFAPQLAAPHRVEGIALFGQVDRDAPFDVVQWFPLRGRPAATAGASAAASTTARGARA